MTSLFQSSKPDADTARRKELKAQEMENLKAKKKEEEEGLGQVGEMKRGDYMIHVLLEKGKDFKVEENSTVDPMLEVTCMGQKMYSQAKDDIGGISEVTWSEHIFLEPKNVSKKDAEKAKIKLRMLDKGLFKNTLIGEYEFDATKIYFRKNHALLHKWLAISDPYGEDYTEVTGYLKVSISITGVGDESIKIEDDDRPENEQDTDILMPPSLNPDFYQIKFKLFNCQGLPIMDQALLGLREEKTDAFVTTKYQNKELSTSIVIYRGKDNIDWWRQEIWIPAQYPIIQKSITLKVMDEDEVFNEVIGSIDVDVDALLKSAMEAGSEDKDGKRFSFFCWKNIYGSPMGCPDGEAKSLMNLNPEMASNWKGRILMKVECYPTEKPSAKVQDIPDEQDEIESRRFLLDQKYRIIAEVGQACALPDDQKYRVKIIVGGVIFDTGECKDNQSKYNMFNKRFDEVHPLPYQSIEDIGQVIILLIDQHDKPVSYYRESISNFKDPKKDYQWIFLKPDPVVNQVQDMNKAGFISFKMCISLEKTDSKIDFKQYSPWKKNPPRRMQAVSIRAYVYQCRDLPTADEDGSCDPYVQIWDQSKQEKKTKTIEDNLNPLFYQCIQLSYEVRDINDKETYPPFIIDIWDEDKDLFDDQDDYLGRSIIYAKDAMINMQEDFQGDSKQEIPAEPRWHDIKYTPEEPKCGEILISFAAAHIDHPFSPSSPAGVDLASRVETQESSVTMLVLGLRQLESPGILPIKKAYINFNVKSLVPPESQAVSNISTEPGPPGPNPTLNTTIKFSIPLPIDPLYCPKLSSFVYDNIFTGLAQAHVGSFTIPIGDLMVSLAKERKKETENIEQIINRLSKMIEDGGQFEPKNYGKKFRSQKSSINRRDADTSGVLYGQSDVDEDTEIDRQNSPKFDDTNNLLESLRKEINDEEDEQDQILSSGTKQQNMAGIKVSQQKSLKKKGLMSKDNKEVLGPSHQKGVKQGEFSRLDVLAQITETKKSLLNRGNDDATQTIARRNKNLFKAITPSQRKLKKAVIPDIEEEKKERKPSKKEQLRIYIEAKEREIQIEADDRDREEEMAFQSGKETIKIVKQPVYKAHEVLKVDVEENPPSGKIYVGLGWDEDRNTQRKHYRQYYANELELVKEVFPKPSPFNSIEIKKGQARGLDSGGIGGFFSNLFKTFKKDESGVDSSEKIVGYFKGVVEVQTQKAQEQYEKRKYDLVERLVKKLKEWANLKRKEIEIDFDKLVDSEENRKLDLKMRELDIEHLNITKYLTDLQSDVILKTMLNSQEKCIVRLYVLDAFNLSSRDNGSPSDPYLYITCNDTIINERDEYQLDEANPKFFKSYDFEGLFPGCSPLEIFIYDYDEIFGDDLIGKTVIDLEDRFFTLDWRGLKDKPVEYRQIYHQSSMIEQGQIKLWVEIHPALTSKEDMKLWDISEKPAEDFEIRICVFNCKDVKMMDFEGTSDVYCRGFFDSKEDVQETDTHYRNQNGKPDFQYRLVYKVQVPRKDYSFTLQMYDRDWFVAKEMIGEAQLNLKKLIQHCALTKKPLQLNKNYYKNVLEATDPLKREKLEFEKDDESKFWLNMKVRNQANEEEIRGRCKMQIDVLPIELAEKNRVGKAREQPNHSPFLPEPEGRLQLSLNPFDMWKQMIGPEMRSKICRWVCCALFWVLCLAIAPMLFSTFGTGFICKTLLNGSC